MSSGTQLRVLTAAVLIPLVVAAIWLGPTLLVALVSAGITILAMIEFFDLGDRIGSKAYRIWTYISALTIVLQQWLNSNKTIPLDEHHRVALRDLTRAVRRAASEE